MSLFLRYCAPCNNAAPAVDNRGKCAGCGADLKIVDAMALIPALGKIAGEDKRILALGECQAHDKPA
jgi:hypothetical protein